MMPEGAQQIIRSVNIHYKHNLIRGFSFFDKDNGLIWKIGVTYSDYTVTKIMIAENEIIIGVVAKFWSGLDKIYSDF